MIIDEKLRFCGRHTDQVAHVMLKEELVPMVKKLEHQVTTLCGLKFRPSWSGRATLDPVCPGCRRGMGPR